MNKQITIENNLRQLRIGAGMSQREVAQQLGLASYDRISHWEVGSAVPSIVNLFKLSKIFKRWPHEIYRELYENILRDD